MHTQCIVTHCLNFELNSGSNQEDLVDPATVIKEKCAETDCTKYKERLDECNNRVQSKNKTTETCFEEILDFYHCVDHCAADKIFKVVLFYNIWHYFRSLVNQVGLGHGNCSTTMLSLGFPLLALHMIL